MVYLWLKCQRVSLATAYECHVSTPQLVKMKTG